MSFRFSHCNIRASQTDQRDAFGGGGGGERANMRQTHKKLIRKLSNYLHTKRDRKYRSTRGTGEREIKSFVTAKTGVFAVKIALPENGAAKLGKGGGDKGCATKWKKNKTKQREEESELEGRIFTQPWFPVSVRYILPGQMRGRYVRRAFPYISSRRLVLASYTWFARVVVQMIPRAGRKTLISSRHYTRC